MSSAEVCYPRVLQYINEDDYLQIYKIREPQTVESNLQYNTVVGASISPCMKVLSVQPDQLRG